MAKPGASRWTAVSIAFTSASCEAAHALRDRRFLGADAPRLPLKECTSPATCTCTYRKHADRRAGPRRAEDTSGIRRSSQTPERRASRGRRSTDE
jgi:hypothetical protein